MDTVLGLQNKRRFKKKKSKKVFSLPQKRQIASIAHKVAAEPREIGYYDSDYSNYAQNSAGAINPIDTIPQSLADQGRRGDEIVLKSIQFRFQAEWVLNDSVIRFMIIQYKDQTSPTMGRILQSAYTSGTNPLIVHAPLAHDYKEYCNVLYDRTLTVSSYDPVNVFSGIITSGFSRKIKYNGGSTSSISNAIYMVTMSDAGTGLPVLSGVIRLRFSDP